MLSAIAIPGAQRTDYNSRGAGRRGESGVQLCVASGVVFGEGGKQTAEKKKKNRTRKVL